MNQHHRKWIWSAVVLQVLGLIYDVGWHALNPEFVAQTRGEMVSHLSTVHVPYYAGVAAILVTTGRALAQNRHAHTAATAAAFAGALLAAGGEFWHAYTHLQLSTEAAFGAAMLSIGGLAIVIAALLIAGRRERSAALEEAPHTQHRRAA
jgi:hypothetical protein